MLLLFSRPAGILRKKTGTAYMKLILHTSYPIILLTLYWNIARPKGALMDTFNRKRQQECRTLEKMLKIYCHGQHHPAKKDGLCPTCQSLLSYALQRIAHCPCMATKTFCTACKIHCYTPEKREAIRQAMRYSGPRMLLHAPLLALHHIYIQWRAK